MNITHFVESLGLDQLQNLKDLANHQAKQGANVTIVFYRCYNFTSSQIQYWFESIIRLIDKHSLTTKEWQAGQVAHTTRPESIILHTTIGKPLARLFYRNHKAKLTTVLVGAQRFDSETTWWEILPSELIELLLARKTSQYAAFNMNQYLETRRVAPYRHCHLIENLRGQSQNPQIGSDPNVGLDILRTKYK